MSATITIAKTTDQVVEYTIHVINNYLTTFKLYDSYKFDDFVKLHRLGDK